MGKSQDHTQKNTRSEINICRYIIGTHTDIHSEREPIPRQLALMFLSLPIGINDI